jgi:hypothetical protein
VIHINYAALRKDEADGMVLSDELLRKAKGRFGFGARKEVLRVFTPSVRLQAMEVAQRQVNPQSLLEAGLAGVIQALKVYDIGKTEQPFKEFAMPFVKQAMQSAKASLH